MTRREATHVAQFELDTGDGVTLWRVGMAPVGPVKWNELTAAHAVKEDASPAETEDASEAFAVDVVAHTVLWEQPDYQPPVDPADDDESGRVWLEPGDVAAWPDQLTTDVWLSLVEQAFRVSGPAGFEWAQQRLRRAPLLALEMAVAREYRIPHSTLMRWGDDDRALAIADLVETKATCVGCGVPARAMQDFDAATVVVDNCVWCGMLAQARKEASAEQHPRVVVKRGY